MQLIIAGGRDYQVTRQGYDMLDQLLRRINITGVVSGCARGADKCGERWAAARGIYVARFPADWKKHGRRAGPVRNRMMAQYADAVVLFPGGRGTDNMHLEASKAGLPIYDWRWLRPAG
jgi:predicted Rossmann-fold nucleotide-binding protein